MASTLTTFDFALKARYTDQKVENLTMASHPLLANLRKNEEFSGDGYIVPLIYGNPQGIAGTSLATAQIVTAAATTGANAVGGSFTLTAGDYFGTVDIGDKVIVASRNNPGAFLQNKAVEIDGLYESMADSLSIYSFSNGGNALGREGGTWTSGDVITLADASTACNFEVGMYVVADTADGSSTSHAVKAGYTYVTAVDREAGTVTVNDITGITGTFQQSDYLFRMGDFGAGTGAGIMHGLGSFVLSSGTTPPALYGLTRTSDPVRLGGCRVPAADISGKSIEERLQILGAYMTGRYKGPGADAVYMHPEDWQSLAIALAARGQRPLKDDTTRFGFMALECVIGGNLCKVYSDRHCPKGTAFALRMPTWTLHSMLGLIHTLNGDGLQMLRKSTTNNYEYRLVSYPCLATNAPGYNGRVTVS